jgi:uncharacterized membrane protein YccF (DUF307 family)
LEAGILGCLGNGLWIIFGGLILAFLWAFVGLLWCITIIGIPIGLQCFKFANLSLAPFGRDVQYGGSTVSVLVNIIWLLICGVPLAIVTALIGVFMFCTIIGIPFGIQYMKMAKLALMPFGATIVIK